MSRVLPFVFALMLVILPSSFGSDAIEQLKKKEGFWKLAGGDIFSDGGSFCLSFLSERGEILHLFVLAEARRKDGELSFELRCTYDDVQPSVVGKNSALEEGVIWLLQNYSKRPEIAVDPDFANKIIWAIRNRRGPFPEPPKVLIPAT